MNILSKLKRLFHHEATLADLIDEDKATAKQREEFSQRDANLDSLTAPAQDASTRTGLLR